MMGRQQLTLLDRATGRRVTVEVDPTWTTEEMKREMERKGIIGPGETIAFYKPGNNGELVPINSNTVQDLLTLQNMGVTPIMDRGMYQGVWETCRQKLREFANSKGLHFSDYGDMVAASGSFWSPYDESGTKYFVTFKCPDIPGQPPEVYIMPYPQYVKRYQRFKISHADACCRPVSGNRCFWHIQEDIMRDRDLSHVLELIYNSIIQVLQLNRVWV
jgi:metal-sulfur cluster biosynthetic enzyme